MPSNTDPGSILAGLLEHDGPLSRRVADTLQLSQRDREGQLLSVENKVPKNKVQKEYLGEWTELARPTAGLEGWVKSEVLC